MSRLAWDATGEKFAEAGIKYGVLYPMSGGVYSAGVAWNGLTSVGEAPTGAEATPFYADNQKYLEIMSAEEFAGTIGCYTYPDAFKSCVGEGALTTGISIGQQTHTKFGLVYRTEIINDTEGVDYGYKLHIAYNALAGISSRDHTTINDSPAFEELSFDFTATKVNVTDSSPTAHLVIDSSKVSAVTLATFEDILFGTVGVDPRLPLPDEIKALFIGGAPSAITVSILPADDATAIVVSANVVLTFNNQIVEEAITVTSAAGVLIAGAKTWDTAGKVLTFDPTSNLSAATMYLVTVAGVVDIYAQTLAATVKKFTTA